MIDHKVNNPEVTQTKSTSFINRCQKISTIEKENDRIINMLENVRGSQVCNHKYHELTYK